MQFSDRLREERERLGLTQDEMATQCGTSKRSYCAYEAGESQPKSDFMASFANVGGDVLYILTGQRSAGTLAPDEAALLDNYRHTPPEKRHTVQEVTSAFAEYDQVAKRARGGSGK